MRGLWLVEWKDSQTGGRWRLVVTDAAWMTAVSAMVVCQETGRMPGGCRWHPSVEFKFSRVDAEAVAIAESWRRG